MCFGLSWFGASVAAQLTFLAGRVLDCGVVKGWINTGVCVFAVVLRLDRRRLDRWGWQAQLELRSNCGKRWGLDTCKLCV